MPHRDAPLTETGRLRLARCIVEDGWPLRRAAERFQVAVTTAARWANRYRSDGEARDGRPVLPTTPQPEPDPDPPRATHHQRPGPAPRGPARIGFLSVRVQGHAD